MKKELVCKHIKELIPYQPGKPIEELERELGIQNSIKLASNESPVGPSPAVTAAIRKALKNLNRYPDGGGFYLKKDLARKWRLDMSNFILGNGTNEILELIAKTFLMPGEEAIMGHPSFVVYQLAVQGVNGKKIVVPLKEYTHDLVSMFRAVTRKTKMIFIANPNNPTGTMVSDDEVDSFMRRIPERVIVVMDEAYSEYVTRRDFPETLKYLREGRNIIILRTFSKIYGLAGLRIGYGMARKDLVYEMNRARQPFNTNSLAQVAATAALRDKEYVKKLKKMNTEGRQFLYTSLDKMGIEYVPSEANFILVRVGDADRVYKSLLEKGVIVRPMAGFGMKEHIRVTIGIPAENRRLIRSLKAVNSGVRHK
jgi:histidinol-phosphate aminotransferase